MKYCTSTQWGIRSCWHQFERYCLYFNCGNIRELLEWQLPGNMLKVSVKFIPICFTKQRNGSDCLLLLFSTVAGILCICQNFWTTMAHFLTRLNDCLEETKKGWVTVLSLTVLWTCLYYQEKKKYNRHILPLYIPVYSHNLLVSHRKFRDHPESTVQKDYCSIIGRSVHQILLYEAATRLWPDQWHK